VCSGGKCGVTCLGGSTLCSNKCVDVQNDAANCGSCGKACAAGQVCAAGVCGVTCLGGSTLCSNKCVDVQNDAANCGGCGKTCAAGQVCAAGQCGVVCLGGTTLCSGKCVDTKVDAANCGGCAKVCASGANSTPFCSASTCALACAPGWADLDGNAANGCETAVGAMVDITPQTGTLYDPGNPVYWVGRYYTVTFNSATQISGIDFKMTLANADTIRAEIWDTTTQLKVATGTTVNGTGVQAWVRSNISFVPVVGRAYQIGVFFSNGNTVFPRKDTPTFPYTVGNVTVASCWAKDSDVYPNLSNVWAPFFRIYE
jgi:hypothetical protein